MQLGGRFACSRAGAGQEIIVSFGEGAVGYGWGVEVVILIPKETLTLVIFRGGGGSGSPDPPFLYGFRNQENR